ncbi:MAG TPA: carboxypeptidase-like regulatory domain-containing protein [Pyrinomonadaceae bacterium]|nr:carboxypeptidase-like regulatory domain-containing protein [Pyrinomonadaceae bacterium]
MSTEKNLQNIIELMRRDESVDAPSDSVRWASNLFRTRAPESKPSLVKKLAAVFQMEIAPNKPAFGERSASAAAVRQILYTAGDNAIDIRIEKAKRAFNLRGQVLGEGLTKAVVSIVGSDNSYEIDINETGEFRLDGMPAGSYEITIRSVELEITLKAFEIE